MNSRWRVSRCMTIYMAWRRLTAVTRRTQLPPWRGCWRVIPMPRAQGSSSAGRCTSPVTERPRAANLTGSCRAIRRLRYARPRRLTCARWTRRPGPPAAGRENFEFGSGYDSNANASTSDTTFLGVTLDPANVETPSAFLQASFALGNVRPVGASSRAVTVARIGHRWNADAGFVDQTIASIDTNFDFGDGPTVFSVGAGGHYGLLDGDPHQWGLSGDLGLAHRFDRGWQVRGLLRAATIRYDHDFGSLSVLDARPLPRGLHASTPGRQRRFRLHGLRGQRRPPAIRLGICE